MLTTANQNKPDKAKTKGRKAERVRTRAVLKVKDIARDYRRAKAVGLIRPKAVDPKEHAATVSAATSKAETLRDIAKFLASSIPLEGEQWGQVVDETERKLESMSKGKRNAGQLVALRTAYRFAKRVPLQERKDLFDELYLTLTQKGLYDVGLAHAVAMHDWCDWWRAYKVRSHYSLEDRPKSAEGEASDYGSLLVGVCDFEAQMIGKVDGERLLSQLPDNIRRICQKRLDGYATTKLEQSILRRWVNQRPTILAQYTRSGYYVN